MGEGDDRMSVLEIEGADPHGRGRGLAEGDHPAGRHMCCGHHTGVVGVDHCDAVCRQGRQDLGLGRGHPLLGTEFREVRVPHVEEQRHIRRRDAAQVADVTDAAGAHLCHQIPRLFGHLEDGPRESEFIVERSLGGDRRTECGQHHPQQILGTRLAG